MHKSQINNMITLLVVTAALFIKSVFYRQSLGMDTIVVGEIITAYLAVGAASLLAALLTWLPKRWPSIVLLILTDLWFIAGIWYYRANMLWLNWNAVSTITELKGFEASIIGYLSWSQLLLPLTTLLAVWVLLRIPAVRMERKAWRYVSIGIVVLFLGSVIGRLLFPLDEEERQTAFRAERTFFLRTHSPLAQVGMIAYEAIEDGLFHWHASRPLNAREEAIMADIYRPDTTPHAPKGHLVYILVESLETWALETEDAAGHPIGSHLLGYVASHPVLYVPNIETQQIYGRSGDGQLITQTGLLPISSGVACRRYGTNVYPNLAHFYADGAVVNPYRVPVWNQKVVTYSYGFHHLISPHALINQTDSITMERTKAFLSKATAPTMVLALTVDTHTPFRSRRDSIALKDGYSNTEQDYLRSVHYTDRQIGRFLQWCDTSAVMCDATIVITADHNHFPRENGHGRCPLIIASPQITRSITYPEALQMDIFPTVLHAIEQTDYAWRGFGVDLLNDDAADQLAHRSIRAREAYSLSDKLIPTNFFAQ